MEMTSEVLCEVFYLFSQQKNTVSTSVVETVLVLTPCEAVRMRKYLMAVVSVLQEGKRSGGIVLMVTQHECD